MGTRKEVAAFPERLCGCGCGQATKPQFHRFRERGFKRGEPALFINNHHNRGSLSPEWKGGRANNNGYVMVSEPGHPRAGVAGYVREHVLVASRAMGKPVPATAVVHHVNGDRSDNRPCNLVVCQDRTYHLLLHRRARALAECGHADWRRCGLCSRYSPPEDMQITKDGRHARHRECSRLYYAKRAKARALHTGDNRR